MFLGTHTLRLDNKFRLVVPARFRRDVETGVVICKGQDRCLYLFPIAEFARVTEALNTAPVTDRRVRDYGRVLFASASQETLDAQGRIVLPSTLREYAGLNANVTLIGANTRIEIWEDESWAAYLLASEQAFSDIAEQVLPGVL